MLLIDEIDKADLEFPNDLLRELDEMRFTIIETSEEIAAKHRPVVLITSNNEKELPDAFLRRCIFYFIEFPDVSLMRQIIDVHHPHLDAKLLDQVLIKFYWLREQNELRKKPSTAELVDWISALLRSGISIEKVEAHIPFVGALLKKEQDIDALTQYDAKGGRYPKSWQELGPRYNQQGKAGDSAALATHTAPSMFSARSEFQRSHSCIPVIREISASWGVWITRIPSR